MPLTRPVTPWPPRRLQSAKPHQVSNPWTPPAAPVISALHPQGRTGGKRGGGKEAQGGTGKKVESTGTRDRKLQLGQTLKSLPTRHQHAPHSHPRKRESHTSSQPQLPRPNHCPKKHRNPCRRHRAAQPHTTARTAANSPTAAVPCQHARQIAAGKPQDPVQPKPSPRSATTPCHSDGPPHRKLLPRILGCWSNPYKSSQNRPPIPHAPSQGSAPAHQQHNPAWL